MAKICLESIEPEIVDLKENNKYHHQNDSNANTTDGNSQDSSEKFNVKSEYEDEAITVEINPKEVPISKDDYCDIKIEDNSNYEDNDYEDEIENTKIRAKRKPKGCRNSSGYEKCKICKETFKNKYNLQRHVDSVHEGKTFTCHLCNAQLRERTSL